MNAIPKAVTPEVEQVWAEYLDARDRAEKSRDINDGIKAGQAWARWTALFEERPTP